MTAHFHLDVVSAEQQIYAKDARKLFVRGTEGDLGIIPGHLQLLTRIVPGPMHIEELDGTDTLLYVSGGILEVQPTHVSVLADVVERSTEISEEEAIKAKHNAEELLSGKSAPVEMDKAMQQLAEAVARLRVIELMRLREKKH